MTTQPWSRDAVISLRDASLAELLVEPVTWDRMQRWVRTDYAISHESGGFFDLAGVHDPATGQRRLMIHQVQSALTTLVRHRSAEGLLYLVQARQEPGNLNGVQLAPTIQSTPANYLAMHGGRSSDYYRELFRYSPGVDIVSDSYQMDLGLRYQGKTKRAMILDSRGPLETTPGFMWISGQLLVELIEESGLVNPDLRTLMSVAPWSADASEGFVPRSRAVLESLSAPVRSEVMAALLAALVVERPARHEAVPFAALDNWEWTDSGLRERRPEQGFTIGFFSVTASNREVPSWTQPLVDSAGIGVSELWYRMRDDVLEIGLGVVTESGMVAGRGVVPSRLVYPGDPLATPGDANDAPPAAGRVSTLESDEGGRFYRDVSRYVTRAVSDSDDGQALHWLRVSEFKALLRYSNTVSMQLRAQASQLLALQLPDEGAPIRHA